MFPQQLDAPQAFGIAQAMMDGFDRHYRLFRAASARAKRRFEQADWSGQQTAQRGLDGLATQLVRLVEPRRQHEQAPVPSAVEGERQLVSRAAAWCGARPFGEFERGHAEAALPSAKASRPP